MKLVIEKNIPRIPARSIVSAYKQGEDVAADLEKALKKMKKGDSVLIPGDHAPDLTAFQNRITAKICYFVRKQEESGRVVKFETRRVGGGVRAWKVK